MKELKQCPFCGGKAEFNLLLGNYGVTCTECLGAIFPAKGLTREEAAEAWNRRANNGWILVSEQLPEEGVRTLAIIKHHEWISDYDSNRVPEEEKVRHPEYIETCEVVYWGERIGWEYRDMESIPGFFADYAFVKPKGKISLPVAEVIAWKPLGKVRQTGQSQWKENMMRKFLGKKE